MNTTRFSTKKSFVQTKKFKYISLGIRCLWLTILGVYLFLTLFLFNTWFTINDNEKVTYSIADASVNLLTEDKVFGFYFISLRNVSIICTILIIVSTISNILFSFNIQIYETRLRKYEIIAQVMNLSVQLLLMFLYYTELLNGWSFYYNIDQYKFWFEKYTTHKSHELFVLKSEELCKVHYFLFAGSLLCFMFPFMEYVMLCWRTDKLFRKKLNIFFFKILTGYMCLALFITYIKNKHFFKNILSEYNNTSLDRLNEETQIIIYAVQYQKIYYLNLLIVACVFCAVFFISTGYYDFISIIKSSKLMILANVLISISFLIIIFSELLFSTYIYETNKYFCSYEDYFTDVDDLPKPDKVETIWFCNMKYLLSVYFANMFICFFTFCTDFCISTYMVFSKKYS